MISSKFKKIVCGFGMLIVGIFISAISIGNAYATDYYDGNYVDEQDIDSVRSFCEYHPNSINVPGKDCGETVLMRAVKCGCVDSVNYLAEHGADINMKDNYSRTPLMHAVDKENLDMVKCLIENGSDVNIMGYHNDGFTALSTAKNIEIIKYLVENEANINAPCVLCRWSNMTDAEYTEKVKYLVEHGVNVNFRFGSGGTPLGCAVEHGCVEAAKCLIEHGVDVNSETEYSRTPLMIAVSEGQSEIVKCLVEHGAEIDERVVKHANNLVGRIFWFNKNQRGAKTDAYTAEALETIKCLLNNGVDVNANEKGSDNSTLLTLALRHKKLDVAKCLLEHGADANVKFDYGNTPLSWAIQWGDLDLVKCLLKHGADINQKVSYNRDYVSPLVVAIYEEKSDVVRYLEAHGAKIDDNEVEREVLRGDSRAVKLLVEHGAKIGDYAIYYAAGKRYLSIVKYLVEHGAKIDKHMIEFAAYSGYVDIVKYLTKQIATK